MSGKGEPGSEVNGAPRLLLYVADPTQVNLSQNATQQHLSLNQVHSTLEHNHLQQQKHIIEVNGKVNGSLVHSSDVKYLQSSKSFIEKQNNCAVRTIDGTFDPYNASYRSKYLEISVENNSRCLESGGDRLVNKQSDFGVWSSEPFSNCVLVPLGWRRILEAGHIVYISPSGAELGSLAELREYLQTSGTCKCGLPCPLKPEFLFCFDPKGSTHYVEELFYAITGCDSTSKIASITKKGAWKSFQGNACSLLQGLGSIPLTDQVVANAEEFVVQLYKVSPEIKTGDAARSFLFGAVKNAENLPPTSDSLRLHIRRCHYQIQSKPYQFPPGGDLTKLCNHKRKLIASMLPGGNIESVIDKNKKKTKQSRMLPQIVTEQSNTDYKLWQEQEFAKAAHERAVNMGPVRQAINNKTESNDHLVHMNRNTPGSHYLTVNNGFINTPNIKQHHINSQELAVGSPVIAPNGQIIGMHNAVNRKDLKKDNFTKIPNENLNNYCPGKQTLTPEVIQNINHQQHIFIQQNQKQIEMAMKAFKNQMIGEQNSTNSQQAANSHQQNHFIIQNGAVININQQRTPPWQVKKVESSSVPVGSPAQRTLFNNCKSPEEEANSSRRVDQLTCQENIANMRIPPLQQHCPQINTQNANESQMKKGKNKNAKKGRVENRFTIYGNNTTQDEKKFDEYCGTNPSFMDDPSGYLAQQTVLLNNTISRQLNNFEEAKYNQNMEMRNKHQANKQYKPSCMLSSLPDSSIFNESQIENTHVRNKMQNAKLCCQGCSSNDNFEHAHRGFSDKSKHFMTENELKMSGQSTIDDNSLISSTYVEKIGNQSCQNDYRGPIQAGAISTSISSPADTLQLPEPSPTPSNSSRNSDTPQSNNSGSVHISSSCNFTVPSPAYSNPGSYREGSDPPTPNPHRAVNSSPGSPLVINNQMMNFISNHNVNLNLMEKDSSNMSLNSTRVPSNHYDKRNSIHFCPPPHLGGGPIQTISLGNYPGVTNSMAFGQTVMRDTITSVLAGRAQTATTSINASNDAQRLHFHPDGSNQKSYAPNHPDPFINSINFPTSYPLHIAGTTAQNMIHKSPLEMVQSVVSNVIPNERGNKFIESAKSTPKRSKATTPLVQSGQIIISSTGQLIINQNANNMPPPAPKLNQVQNVQASNVATNVTASVTQMIPAVGNVGQVLNQPTMLVNALPGQLVIQPQMMIDGQMVSQNAVLPQIVTGNVISPGQSSHDTYTEVKQGMIQRLSILSPEKKKSKKRKQSSPNITNVLHIAAPQNGSSGVILQNSPTNQTSPQFSPRGFQFSPNQNISPTPVLQALTIVPGKSGAPAHIVMNGQNSNSFSSQQILNTSPTQQINLLQPVNLLNNPVQNFTGFQQFILPNLNGGMVMTADGTLLQDTSSMPMQLQLQNVNGQNVLTPVQNTSPGVVIRTQNSQGKIVQSQTSPGTQFLSPNGTIMVNNSFSGQLSPLIAFETSPRSKTTHETHQVVLPATTRNQSPPNRHSMIQNATQVRQTLMLSEVPQNTSLQLSHSVSQNSGCQKMSGLSSNSNKMQLSNTRPDSTAHSPPDTTTSPEPDASAMVHCVSSSEQDASWTNSNEPSLDANHGMQQTQQMKHISNYQSKRDKNEFDFNQTTETQQHNFYEKKRKCEYTYEKTEKIMRTSSMMHSQTKEPYFDENLIKFNERSNENGATFYARKETYNANESGETHTDEDDTTQSPSRSGCKNFNPGDLVWGPAKGYPAWPGKLMELQDDKALVKWFGGDRARSLVEVNRLQTLDEGFEAHHQARKTCRKSRKLNTQLEKAIQEAMSELDKMADTTSKGDGRQRNTRKQTKKQKNAKTVKDLVKIAPNPNRDIRLRSSQNR